MLSSASIHHGSNAFKSCHRVVPQEGVVAEVMFVPPPSHRHSLQAKMQSQNPVSCNQILQRVRIMNLFTPSRRSGLVSASKLHLWAPNQSQQLHVATNKNTAIAERVHEDHRDQVGGPSNKFAYQEMKNHTNIQGSLPKEPQVYNFCILNETIFEHVLSFIGNQTLTKLQMITGDHYPNCDPQLAKYCCVCENDNPAIFCHLCRECESKCEGYKSNTTLKVARLVYGVPDFSTFVIHINEKAQGDMYFARISLENLMLQVCGSKMGWLRRITELDADERKKAVQEQHERQERDDFIDSFGPEYAAFVRSMSSTHESKAELKRCFERFITLRTAFEKRGLELQTGLTLAKDYIVKGAKDAEFVVDVAEETNFLYRQTEYAEHVSIWISDFHAIRSDSRQEYEKMLQGCQDIIKMQLCTEYLQDNRGLQIPRKWEKCRSRLETVTSAGMGLIANAQYIYSGEGNPFESLKDDTTSSSAPSSSNSTQPEED